MRVTATLTTPTLPEPAKSVYPQVTKVVYTSESHATDIPGIFIHFRDGVLQLDRKVVLDLIIEE